MGTAIFFVIPYIRALYYSLIDNRFRRNFVRRADIVGGQEYGGYVEVMSGLSCGYKIVASSDRELFEEDVVRT